MRFLATITIITLSIAGAENLNSAPLAPPSPQTGATLFTRLSPEETGILANNEYADPRMWGERYQEFALGSIGTGITVGDYDNDGKPDLYIVNKTGPSKLFRNLGNWKFEDTTQKAGLAPEAESGLLSWFSSDEDENDVEIWKQGAAFADIDNDGDLDLYLCRNSAPNQLFINQGDGTFTEAEDANGLALNSASGMACFADFDRDGWLDVYVQTNLLDAATSSDGNRDRLYRNNGDGTFADISDAAGISGLTLGHSATWWDFNEDKWPDLYVANDFDTPDTLYRNNGDGTFTNVLDQVIPHQSFSSMGADLGDIDNNGHIDFFVADMAPTTHEMDHRGMAITRYSMREENTPLGVAPQYMYNALYLNHGAGRMQEGAWLYGIARTDWTWSPRFVDLDNDGWLDLHVTNGMSREYQNDDLRQRIYRTINPQARLAVMKSTPVMNESNLAYRNQKGQGFKRIEQEWGLGEVGVSFGTAYADFDNDGDLDIAYTNLDAPPTILRNESQSGNRVIFDLRGSASNRYGVGASIEIQTKSGKQLRQLVLARGYLSSSEPALHFGLGEDTTIQRATISWPSGETQVLENIPANQRLLVQEPSKSQASPASPRPELVKHKRTTPIFKKEAAPSLSPTPKNQPKSNSPFLESTLANCDIQADFNGDGIPDHAIGNQGLNTHYQATPENPIVFFEGNFGGRRPNQRVEAYYQDGRLLPFASRKEIIAAIPSLQRRIPSTNKYAASTIEEIFPPAALANANRTEITELRSGLMVGQPDGSQRFIPFPFIAQIAPIQDFGVADFDGDGHLDLVAAQNNYEVPAHISRYDGGLGQLLLGNGDGTFRTIDPETSGIIIDGHALSIHIEDLNQDGKPDFIVQRAGQEPIAFLNQSEGTSSN